MTDYQFVTDFLERGVLTAEAFQRGIFAVEDNVTGAVDLLLACHRVTAACTPFREELWEPRLKEYYKTSSLRGHSARLGDLTLLLWGIAGRVMLTLKRSPQSNEYGTFISLLGYETEDGLYVCGAWGSPVDLCDLLVDATIHGYSLATALHPDPNVSLLGL